ncbi:MAG: hypothetical protein ABIQ95_09650 [Bdellovibrionia bacterium]
MKNLHKLNLKIFGVTAIFAFCVSGNITLTPQTISSPQQNKSDLALMENYFSMIDSNINIFKDALAEDTGNAECNTKSQTAWAGCFTKNSTYAHGALNYFNHTLCILNQGFPSQVETSLCHFSKSLSMTPNKAALPTTVTKTFGGKTIVLTVENPTEAFATTAGYDAKGTVKINGTTFMVLYWGGTDALTKGFMISGAATGMGANSVKNPSYIQWDRTVSTAQFVKVFVANYATAYLTSFSSMSSTTPMGGDRAMYGHATYDAITKAVTAQTVSIEAQRGGATTTAGCFKMYATGIKDGAISIAKTRNSFSLTGHALADTSKDGTDMDAAVLTDSASTVNGTGNFADVTSAGMTVTFTKSCNDVYTASATTKAFASNDVSFTAVPTDIF